MPIVQVVYERGFKFGKVAKKLANVLPGIIAPQISTSTGILSKKTIKVHVRKSSKRDVHVEGFQILIFVDASPERMASMEERKNAIIKGIQEFLGKYDCDISGFIWILPVPETALGVF